MGARSKRPTAHVRTSKSDDGSTIVESSAPNGQGLLIELHASATGALFVVPYRADERVYLMTRAHENGCRLYVDRSDDRVCDCGACLVYDAKACTWRPTSKDSP